MPVSTRPSARAAGHPATRRGITLRQVLLALVAVGSIGLWVVRRAANTGVYAAREHMKTDLHNFAIAEEEAFDRLGRYLPPDSLQAAQHFTFGRFVRVDSSAVGRDRWYLRLRHTRADDICWLGVALSPAPGYDGTEHCELRVGERPAADDGAPLAGAAIDTVGVFRLYHAPSPPIAGAPITFRLAPTSPAEAVNSATWNFGDGTTATGATVTHAFAAPGPVIVSVAGYDDAGRLGTGALTLQIAGTGGGPTPGWQREPATPWARVPTVFDCAPSVGPAAPVVRCDWDFGDGQAAVGAPATPQTHTYAAAGPYVVTLRVTDGGGRTAASADTVTVRAPDAHLALALAPAGPTTCALDPLGRVACWPTMPAPTPTQPVRPAPVAAGPWRQLATAGRHSCAVSPDGHLACWGDGPVGVLGTADGRPGLVAAPDGAAWAEVTVGPGHACARTVAGAAFCWGQNASGQLGTGTAGGSHGTPRPVAGGLAWRTLAVGGAHSCGVAADGLTYCWGANGAGQVGAMVGAGSPAPVAVNTRFRFTAVTAGAAHTCALADQGMPYCWGANGAGQVGDGGRAPHGRPVLVGRGLALQQFAAVGDRTCGATQGGDAVCWGGVPTTWGDTATAGAPGPTFAAPAPVRLPAVRATPGLGRWRAVVPSGPTACALAEDGRVACWTAAGQPLPLPTDAQRF